MSYFPTLRAPCALLACLAAGCFESPIGQPENKVIQVENSSPEQAKQDQFDILFMIDNSRSMEPKQKQLKDQFPSLISRLDAFAKDGHPASYHIGVVTSDLAAGPLSSAGGGTAPSGTSGCRMNGGVRGDGGKLVNVGANADPSCKPIDPKGGGNFIIYDQVHTDKSGGPANNFPAGQDLAKTFTCMASVGDTGCGMEHQLESVMEALQPKMLAPGAPNSGFLRDAAVLVVVFVTDEDDCSAPPDTDLFAQDTHPLKSGKKAFDELGYFHSFRCTEWGIKCGGLRVPRGSMTAMSGCQPLTQAEGGKLYDVSRYTDFFNKLKNDPSKVLLASISAPPDTLETIYATCDKQQEGAYPQNPATCNSPLQLNDNQCMAMGAPNQMCSVVLQHSTVGNCKGADSSHFGDPAIRLNAVINAQAADNIPKNRASICDPNYDATLNDIADKIRNHIVPHCITLRFDNPTKPQCNVSDIITCSVDHSMEQQTDYKDCDSRGNQAPCWRQCRTDSSVDGGCGADQVLVKLCRSFTSGSDPKNDQSCEICDDTAPAAPSGCSLKTRVECATVVNGSTSM